MSLQSNILSYNHSLIELNQLLTQKDYQFESDKKVWDVFHDTYRQSFPEDFEAAFHMQTGVYPHQVVGDVQTIKDAYQSIKAIKESSIVLPELDYSTELEKIELIQSLEPFRTHHYEYKKISQAITDYSSNVALAKILNAKAKQAGLRKDSPSFSNGKYARHAASAKVQPCFSVNEPCTNEALYQTALARKAAAKAARPLYFFSVLLCVLLPFIITAVTGIPLFFIGFGVIVSPVIFVASIFLSVKLGKFLKDQIYYKECARARVVYLPICAKEFDKALDNLNDDKISNVLKIVHCLDNMFACVEAIHEQCNLVGSDNKKLLEMFKDLIVRGLAENTAQAAEISKEALENKLETEKLVNALTGAAEAQRQAREREKERERIKNSFISASSALKEMNKNLKKLQELEEEKINKIDNIKNDLHHY